MNRYKEVLNPPLTFISFVIFMYISMAFAIWAAFDFFQALATMALLLATIPFIWRKQRMVISIDDELWIDRAHIELNFLKDPQVVDKNEYKALRSFKSDARSFHATRPWLKEGVKVSINDERDQTTYWLIGSKKASELAKALAN